ncbi:MAG: MFS transporter, partial [Chloroflexota bacterium]|nr:MFS transporter [Chloroflexota bacterium]
MSSILFRGNNRNRFSHAAIEEEDRKSIIQSWLMVITGFLLVFILYGTYYSFGVFVKPVSTSLGWSRALTTGVVFVYMVIHGIFSIIAGRLTDRYGPRFIIAISALLVALGYGLSFRISTPWHLYIYFGILVGSGMGAAFVVPVSTVTRWFTYNRGLALGIVSAGVGAGQMILPPFMRYMILEYGWRTSFAVMGIMVCVVGIPAALLLRNPPCNMVYLSNGKAHESWINNGSMTKSQGDWSITEAIKTSSFHFLLCVFIALIFGLVIITSHLVAHVEDIGIDPLRAAYILTLIGGGGILGRIIIGRACDKTGSKAMLASCMIVQALLLFSLIRAENLWAFYVIAMLFGFTYGGAVPAIIMINSEFFGISSSGTTFGALLCGSSAGAAIGAPFAGYIYDVTGGYSIAFLIGGMVL